MRIELENRLISFSVAIIELSRKLEQTLAGRNMSFQIIKSSTSCALNYGEAQCAQSKRDFIHKISIVVKELKETQINLSIIQQAQLSKSIGSQEDIMKECSELIAIFTQTVKTAKRNLITNN